MAQKEGGKASTKSSETGYGLVRAGNEYTLGELVTAFCSIDDIPIRRWAS